MDHKDRRGTLVCNVSDWEGDKQSQSLSILGSSDPTKLQQKVFVVGFSFLLVVLKAGRDCYPLKTKKNKNKTRKCKRNAESKC